MSKRQARSTTERQSARRASTEQAVEHVPRRGKRKPGAQREADFVVIGAGSGGVAAARRAATLGARVVLVERDAIGGTCVNRGCVPKKMLSYGASLAAVLSGCLSHTGGKEDWSDAIVRVNAEMARLHVAYTHRLQQAGVELLRGDATVSAADQVQVGAETIRAKRILIATGARPRALPVPGFDLACTSDDIFTWQSLPASLVVIGGGYVAVEQASILSRYGVKVEMLVREARLLARFDHEVADALAEALAAKGVRLHFNTEVTLLNQANGAIDVCYRQHGNHANGANGGNGGNGNDRIQTVRAQAALAAIGRDPHWGGLGLESLGIASTEKGGIQVDRSFRTKVRSIHAIGDVIDGQHLTPVAGAQGRWLADRLFGRRGDRADFELVPTAVFCEPAIGSVGLTEHAAIEEAGKAERIHTVVRRFVSLENRFAGSEQASMVKLVVNARSGRVLGAHMMDNAAPEIVQAFAVAVRLGVKLAHLQTTVQLHPTVAEELFG
ncbi:dihydrolipoyl dehydrogenase family protein [Cupriavidus sp. D39]|uniref:dihydrolipoyl dehydrogenase family protein n=1 Tax=Cupriavidus sp. D39 TaxID=2997877 RepID=UPI0022703F8F|nr:FAD-dependent oxidoreductase [Cupriavidus sp. D39]MCY0857062.1 FAD-dependent oxidoreductase [Cupriavidus sp. D39]